MQIDRSLRHIVFYKSLSGHLSYLSRQHIDLRNVLVMKCVFCLYNPYRNRSPFWAEFTKYYYQRTQVLMHSAR